jgi:homoserine dehydrogenase
MLAELAVADPLEPADAHASSPRTIRVGILGLGSVGQAVARLAPEAQRFHANGVRLRILNALVRDVHRTRRCPRPARLTSNPEAFLRGHYDVVIEALGTVEPARTIVARLLGRGIPVVTANKALVAAHGLELASLAARRGTSLRFEASAFAGIPFLGALSERPFVADVTRFTAVVNGTSNFILSTIEAEQCAFDDASARARRLGLTEPDASRDLDGLDAADKFLLLASLFGWGVPRIESLEINGIRGLAAADLAAAHRLGGSIKPVVYATHSAAALDAFVGPAFVPSRHPLASLGGTLSGIQLSGRYVADLFFSGPGAGPDVTAATILDDAIEAVSTVRRIPKRARRFNDSVPLAAPTTEWLLRVRFPGVVPAATTAQSLIADAGLAPLATTESSDGSRWLRIAPAPRPQVDRAIAGLRQTHRIDGCALRAL